MELRHLRYFIAVAEDLHFGHAAAKLNIVQPALSMQIKALEKEIGVDLLSRNRRNVNLTDAGRLFLVEAKRTLEQAENAIVVARRAGKGTLGRVRVGYSASAIHSGIVAKCVGQFRKEYPDVEIAIEQIDPWKQIEAISKGLVDFVFGPGLGRDIDRMLTSYPLASFAPWLALPEDHRFASLSKIDPGLLSDETFVEYAGSSEESAAVLEYFLGFRPVPDNVRRANDPVAVLALVEAGQGISIIPSILAQRLAPSSIIYRPLACIGRYMQINLVALRDPSEPVIGAFLKMSSGSEVAPGSHQCKHDRTQKNMG